MSGSQPATNSLPGVVGSADVEQEASTSTTPLTNHSINDTDRKPMIDSSDSSHDETSTDQSNMVTSDSKSSVSSSDAVNSENQIDRNTIIDMKSDHESIDLVKGGSESVHPVEGSVEINENPNVQVEREVDSENEHKTKELELEREIHMNIKCEAPSNIEVLHNSMEFSHGEEELSNSNVESSHTNMEISFTQDDLANEDHSERLKEETICDSKIISETNIVYSTENKQLNVESRTNNVSPHTKGKAASSSYVSNMSKLYNSVEIIVQDEDTEMTSPVTSEDSLHTPTSLDSYAKGNNAKKFTFDKEEASSSEKLSDNPHKRGMCNDSIPSVVGPVNTNETEDEINYDFISVSKRVRNYEQALSPQRSPQISPKSPRSPRIARLQRRSSHNSPYPS